MPRIIASIEARMSSSRLPGKVLAPIYGEPAIQRLLVRLRRCKRLDGIILATTTSQADDALQQWAERNSLAYYRGSEQDVLGRVVAAQRQMDGEIVVEVTGDCILLDPELVDMAIDTFLANECDLLTNVRTRSYPMGEIVQVFTLQALEEVEATIDDPEVREHVSLYFYQHPERYRIINLVAPARWTAPDYRFHLDYPQDLQFLEAIHSRLVPTYGDGFGIEEVMNILRAEPHLAEINSQCCERSASALRENPSLRRVP
jgi:spore coat polysaccharide biosynthesis protein SpsF